MSFSTAFGLIGCLLTSIPFVHSAALTQNQTNGLLEIAHLFYRESLLRSFRGIDSRNIVSTRASQISDCQ